MYQYRPDNQPPVYGGSTGPETTIKCPICGQSYVIYHYYAGDQSACPSCRVRARRHINPVPCPWEGYTPSSCGECPGVQCPGRVQEPRVSMVDTVAYLLREAEGSVPPEKPEKPEKPENTWGAGLVGLVLSCPSCHALFPQPKGLRFLPCPGCGHWAVDTSNQTIVRADNE